MRMTLIMMCVISIILYLYGVTTLMFNVKPNVYFKIMLSFTMTYILIIGINRIETRQNTINIEQECKKNHISYELVKAIDKYSDKNEKEIYDFLVMVADDEMDLGDAITFIDSSLTRQDINDILKLSSEMENKK